MFIIENAEEIMNEEFNNYIPPSWDERFMKQVYFVAECSKDPRTKIGAVLVKDKNIIATGYNGFPRGVSDNKDRYLDKNIKYKMVAHAEDNAILTCARLGISTLNSILYTNGIPCNTCTISLIQGGIKEIVVHKQWPNLIYSPIWVESINISNIMLQEAGINIRWLDKELNMTGYLDGKKFKV